MKSRRKLPMDLQRMTGHGRQLDSFVKGMSLLQYSHSLFFPFLSNPNITNTVASTYNKHNTTQKKKNEKPKKTLIHIFFLSPFLLL